VGHIRTLVISCSGSNNLVNFCLIFLPATRNTVRIRTCGLYSAILFSWMNNAIKMRVFSLPSTELLVFFSLTRDRILGGSPKSTMFDKCDLKAYSYPQNFHNTCEPSYSKANPRRAGRYSCSYRCGAICSKFCPSRSSGLFLQICWRC